MIIDFKIVLIKGLEIFLVVEVLVGLCVNEVCYFWNKFKVVYEIFLVLDYLELMVDINYFLKNECNFVFVVKFLEILQFFLENCILWIYVFYEDGLVINILYELDNFKKRVVGLKLLDGMDIFIELVDKFKFVC